MKKWIALLLGLVLAAAGICLFLSRTWMWADVPRVVSGTLSTGSVTKRFSLPAELEAEAGVDVVPDERLDASLIVQEVCVRVGDAVEAGQTLLRCRPSAALTEELATAEQALERARLSALEARAGTEEVYAAYKSWEAAADAALQTPADAALAAQEARARAELDAACASADARARLSARLTAERRLEAAQEEWTALQALTERAQALTAPQDGIVVYLAGAAGDEIRADETAATLSASPTLLVCAPATAEEAAYFATAQSLLRADVRIGQVSVPAGEPFAAARGGQPLLCAPVQIPGAGVGTVCTLELELTSGDGMLLPRTAVDALREGTVTFFVIEERSGFFGPESFAVRVEAEALDWDEENVLVVVEDVSTHDPIIVESSAPLAEGMQVLLVEEIDGRQ